MWRQKIRFIYCIVLLIFLIINTSAISAEKKFVTYQNLLSELEKIAVNSFEPSRIVRKEFVQLTKTHGIAANKNNYKDFVRVRLAFEATRDSGLWQIRWAITNNKPNSDAIWRQWQKQTHPKFAHEKNARETAIAECDEISALFAFVARGLGVKKVGLFWPTPNHTVAVWTAIGKSDKPVRVVVPTSQIAIGASATLGTKEFDPNKQKTIYNYARHDVTLAYKIPAPMAQMMITQVKKYGGKSAAFLQSRRNRLSRKFDGS